MTSPHRESGDCSTVIRQADDRNPTPITHDAQPAWVLLVIAFQIEMERRRATRLGYDGWYALKRASGHYPDRTA
jgi:hypothetical protein